MIQYAPSTQTRQFAKGKSMKAQTPEDKKRIEAYNIYQYLTRYSIKDQNIPSSRRQLTDTNNPLLEVRKGEWENLGGRAHARAKLYRR